MSRVTELVALTALSALICGVAFALDYVAETAVFAAMACSTGVIPLALRGRLS